MLIGPLPIRPDGLIGTSWGLPALMWVLVGEGRPGTWRAVGADGRLGGGSGRLGVGVKALRFAAVPAGRPRRGGVDPSRRLLGADQANDGVACRW
jgi:hypothetical protein